MLALRGFSDRRICECLQLDDGRSAVDTPEVHDFSASGNASRQGQYLGLGHRLVFGQSHLKGHLVTPELGSFLVELGGFGAVVSFNRPLRFFPFAPFARVENQPGFLETRAKTALISTVDFLSFRVLVRPIDPASGGKPVVWKNRN